MTSQHDTLQNLAADIRKLSRQLGCLAKAWRTCTVSDCRRDRRCVGAEGQCMQALRGKVFALSPDEVTEWNDALLRRRELLRRYKRQSAAIRVTAAP